MRDALFTNLATGLGESYFAAFMLTLGLGEIIAGAGKIIPMFVGVCVQLFAISAPMRALGLKSRVVGFIIVQALTFPALALVGVYQIRDAPIVLGLLSLYWAAGLSSLPPWNRLMAETIPPGFRLRFFARRNALAQGSILAGLLIGGFYLSTTDRQHQLPVFIVMFLACGVLKLFSVRELTLHQNPIVSGREVHVSFRDFMRSLKGGTQGQLIRFLFVWYVVAQIAGVYFDPFMLGQLKWSAAQYTGVIATSFIGRILALWALKRWALPRQMSWVLFFGCLLIGLTPLCWTLGHAYGWILLVEFFCGAGWGAFELATVLLYFERIKDEERISVMTYISFTNTLGMVIGVSIGAWLLHTLPPGIETYSKIFLLSSALRLLVLFFAPSVRVRDVWSFVMRRKRRA
jgi:hypothetical protein